MGVLKLQPFGFRALDLLLVFIGYGGIPYIDGVPEIRDIFLTYISLFSSAGVGCHGFQMEGFHCVATNEIISRRMDVQRKTKNVSLNPGTSLAILQQRV